MKDYVQCKFAEYCRYDHKKPVDELENTKKIEKLGKMLKNLQMLGKYLKIKRLLN